MGHCKCEVDLPVLKKFLFCLPLRPGLIAYGFLQLMATLIISIFAIIDYNGLMRWSYYINPAQLTIIFLAFLLCSIVDMVNSVFLMRAAHKKNNKILEACFRYQKFKVKGYAIFLIICFFIAVCVYSDNFFYYNVDPVRRYMFNENIAVGILDWILQFYVFLLVRSELKGQEDVVDQPTLYGGMRPPCLSMPDEPKKEPLPEGYIQYP